MKTIVHIAVLASILLGAQHATAQSVYVPLDHQVYPLLHKGETLGLFESYQMRILPLTRTVVLDLLHRINNKRAELSSADTALLNQLLGEFTDPDIGEQAKPETERHLYRFEESGTQWFFDLRGTQEVRFHRGRFALDDETISETRLTGLLRARLSEHIFIGADARLSLVRGETDPESRFDPGTGLPQVAVDDNVFTDQATGYIGLDYDWFRLFAGRMRLSWGSGLDERLGLSARNEPMDMLHFTLDFKDVRFSYFHANLAGISDDRYLAGHRLDIRLSDRVQLGVYETVVYARRGIRLAYLNPFVPYHIMEHQEGDKDNNMLGVDLSAVVAPGLRLSGELFIDDLNWSRPIFGYWGNKLAYHASIHWASPLGVQPVELRASYTRIDPWVYTHGDSMNVYTHYDESVGARIGPNADQYSVGAVVRFHRDWLVEFAYNSVRRGQGGIRLPHRPEDGDEKRFLEGVVETRGQLAGFVRYQFFRDMFAGAEAVLTSRRNVNLLPGLTASEKFFRLFVDINY